MRMQGSGGHTGNTAVGQAFQEWARVQAEVPCIGISSCVLFRRTGDGCRVGVTRHGPGVAPGARPTGRHAVWSGARSLLEPRKFVETVRGRTRRTDRCRLLPGWTAKLFTRPGSPVASTVDWVSGY